MDNSTKNKETFIKCSIVLFLLISVIVAEALTRDAVFNFSLRFEKSLQSANSESLTTFFKIISEIGNQYFYLPAIFLIFLFYPLSSSLTYLFNIGLSVVLVEILKNSYGNPRPFWIDSSLFKVCEGGYGNPSGHSIASAAGFLGLWSTLFDVEFFDNKLVWKFSALCAFVLVIILILFSRLFLAAHSLNQVIYGASLGVTVYLLIYVIFKLHKNSAQKFFLLFTKNANRIAFSALFALLITAMLLVYFLKSNEVLAYEETFRTICAGVAEYKRFNKNGIYGGSVVFGLIGAYYGTMLMLYLLCKKHQVEPEALEALEEVDEFPITYKNYMRTWKFLDAVNYWNKTTWKNWVFILLILIASCIPAILKAVVSSNANLAVIFVFKTCLPYLFIGFGVFGVTIYFGFYFELANKAINEGGIENVNNNNTNYSFDDVEFKKVEISSQV